MLEVEAVAFVGAAGAVQVGAAVEGTVVAQARFQEVAGEGRGLLGPDGEDAHRGVEAVGGQAEIGVGVGHFALGFGRRGQLDFVEVAGGFGQRVHALLHNLNLGFFDFATGLAAGAGGLGQGSGGGQGEKDGEGIIHGDAKTWGLVQRGASPPGPLSEKGGGEPGDWAVH